MPFAVPLLDLGSRFSKYLPEIRLAWEDIFSRGRFILGPYLEALEEAMARRLQVPHAVGCASGTDALLLALRALGVGPGDEVIVPAFTFVATAEVVARAGASPIFVDVDPRRGLLDPEKLQEALTSKTRAIIPVHLFGHPAPLGQILDFAQRHSLLIIEDCAQALLSAWEGKPVGGFGDAGCFSFYPSKHLPAAGDAGLVVTKDAEVARRLKRLRNHGRQEGLHEEVGMNSRLDEIQAAVLLVQLRDLDADLEKRRLLAQMYQQALGHLPLVLPKEAKDATDSHLQFTIQCERREEVKAQLARKGVASAVYYPRPVPFEPAFSSSGQGFPVAQELCQKVLSLPLYPEMKEEAIFQVAEAMGEVFSGRP